MSDPEFNGHLTWHESYQACAAGLVACQKEIERLRGFEPCQFVSKHNIRRGVCGVQRKWHGDKYHQFVGGAFAEIAPAREPMMTEEELHGGQR